MPVGLKNVNGLIERFGNGELRQQLGSIPDTELTIPASFYKNGDAREQYTAEFIKYTNCLEMGSGDELVRKVSSPEYGEIPTYTISAPRQFCSRM